MEEAAGKGVAVQGDTICATMMTRMVQSRPAPTAPQAR